MTQAVEIRKTVEEIMNENGLSGYRKVSQDGGTYVVASFWNSETHDFKTKCVRDYDYFDKSRDNDDLYYLDIDEDAKRDWLHSQGRILVGDMVVVEKGRKVRVGTVAYVRDIKPCYDKYSRVQCHFCYLSNGERTYLHNVRLVKDVA